jgi:hypothetical protein
LQRGLLLQDIGARGAAGVEALLRDVELRLLRAAMSSVAAIWARSEASVTAAVTMLAVRLK